MRQATLRSERGLSFYIFNTKPCFLNSNKVLEQTTKEESAMVSEKANKAPQRAGGARVNQALSEPYLLQPAATSALPSSAAAAVGGPPSRAGAPGPARARPNPIGRDENGGAGLRPLYKRELGRKFSLFVRAAGGGESWCRVDGRARQGRADVS